MDTQLDVFNPEQQSSSPVKNNGSTVETTGIDHHDDDYHRTVDIRCLVECVAVATKTTAADVDDVIRTPLPGNAQTLNDKVVRLADRCPFVEIVPAALYQLGYGLEDCIGATGTIHVRNWKPVNCESVSDSPTASVGLILGGTLASLVTLRIRLHRLPKQLTQNDVENKMFGYLYGRLKSSPNGGGNDKVKRETGRGDGSVFPDSVRLVLDQCYGRLPGDVDNTTGRSSSLQPKNAMSDEEQLVLMRLEEWFDDDSEPNDEIISEYARRLSHGSPHHVTSGWVAEWFSERRRRQQVCQEEEDGLQTPLSTRRRSSQPNRGVVGQLTVDVTERAESETGNGNDNSHRRPLSPIVRRVPVLPNRNAVYVIDAILPTKPETQVFDDDDDDDEPEMEIVCGSDVDADAESGIANGRDTTTGELKKKRGEKDEEESCQDEPTDLSMRKPAAYNRSDSGASVGGGSSCGVDRPPPPPPQGNSPSISGRPSIRIGRDDDNRFPVANLEDCVSGGASNSSGSDSPTYHSATGALQQLVLSNRFTQQSHHLLPPLASPSSSSSSAALATSQHPLTSLYQYHQRAFQMAAMSRAAALGFQLSAAGQHVFPLFPTAGARPQSSYVGGIGPTTPSDDFQSFDSTRNNSFSSLRAGSGPLHDSSSDRPATCTDLSKHHQQQQQQHHQPVIGPTMNPADANGGKRSRVFIDPLTEIPKLERWFADDTHPSSYVIEKYTDELNRAPYRQRFPRLEPKNLQLWFKNHRAKMKRQREACSAAAVAAACVVAAAASSSSQQQQMQHHTQQQLVAPSGERNRNGNGFSTTHQLAAAASPYVDEDSMTPEKLRRQQPHQSQYAGTTQAGDDETRVSASDSPSATQDSRFDNWRYGDREEVNSDQSLSHYRKRKWSGGDDEVKLHQQKYIPVSVVTSGFINGGGGSSSGDGSGGGGGNGEIHSVIGRNNNCKDERQQHQSDGGNGSSYASVSSARSVSGVLDALVLRLQNGSCTTHAVSSVSCKPEVH